MQPLGRRKAIGGPPYKKDWHLHDKNHRKVLNWWEDERDPNPEREKRLWKYEVKQELQELKIISYRKDNQMFVKMKDLKIFWEDCAVSFDCPYCGEEVEIDSQGEPTECVCRHVFALSTSISEIVEDRAKSKKHNKEKNL